MDSDFSVEALEDALMRYGIPEIFNTDQRAKFTSYAFTSRLKKTGVRISMDGRGRGMDNIMIERLWRSLKHECIYLKKIQNDKEVRHALADWFDFYNLCCRHVTFDGDKPMNIYSSSLDTSPTLQEVFQQAA